jgi:hypothetical protein
MTKHEFNNWKKAYFTAFPDCEAWLNKLPDPAATLGTWFKCLERCEYADLALVTDKLICGDLKPIDAFSREQTAIHLRAYAGKVADDRHRVQKQMAEREKLQRGRAQAKRYDGPSMPSMFNQILKFREEAVARGLSDEKPTPEHPSDVSRYASDKLEAWLQQNGGNVAVEPGDAFE